MARSSASKPSPPLESAAHAEGDSPSAPLAVPADPSERERFIARLKERLYDPTTGDAAFASISRVLADVEGFAVQAAKAGLPPPLSRERRIARALALLNSLPEDERAELRASLDQPADLDALHL